MTTETTTKSKTKETVHFLITLFVLGALFLGLAYGALSLVGYTVMTVFNEVDDVCKGTCIERTIVNTENAYDDWRSNIEAKKLEAKYKEMDAIVYPQRGRQATNEDFDFSND